MPVVFMRRRHLLRMALPGIASIALVVSCTSTPPLPPDVATGPAIYERLCQKCHGAGGWGDGPQAQ